MCNKYVIVEDIPYVEMTKIIHCCDNIPDASMPSLHDKDADVFILDNGVITQAQGKKMFDSNSLA